MALETINPATGGLLEAFNKQSGKQIPETIDVANCTEFGLDGSVWTEGTAKGESVASSVKSGAVFVNGMVKSEPRLPFGGVKIYGYGRELSHYGIKEFVNIQTVWIR